MVEKAFSLNADGIDDQKTALLRADQKEQANSESEKTQEPLDPSQKTYKVGYMVQTVIVAAIGGFLFGYDTSIIAGAQLFFKNDFPDISTNEIAMIVSFAMIGAAIGAFFSGMISDSIGRKPVILVADVFFTLGSIVMALAPSVGILILGRIIMGIGVGIASQVVPLYLSEIAPVQIRGRIVAINVIAITAAQVLAGVVGFMMRPNWRLMLGGISFLSVIQFIAMLFFMSESPRWLGKEGQTDEQRKAMERIYLPEHVERANKSLKKEVKELRETSKLG